MNLEPFHQVSGDMSRDSVTNTRIRFLKSWYVPASRTSHTIQWWLKFSSVTLTYPLYPNPCTTAVKKGVKKRGEMGCSGRLCVLQWLCIIQWVHLIQWKGWIGLWAQHLAKSCYSSHWPPSVFGFATNKKLISLQSQEKLMRSRAQLLDEFAVGGISFQWKHLVCDKCALFDSDVKLMSIKRWLLPLHDMETEGR